jgi:hypothetical protein
MPSNWRCDRRHRLEPRAAGLLSGHKYGMPIPSARGPEALKAHDAGMTRYTRSDGS